MSSPAKRATRYCGKPESSAAHQLRQRARRHNLVVSFDRQVQAMNGPWIAIADQAGKHLHEAYSTDLAIDWLDAWPALSRGLAEKSEVAP